MSTGTTARGRMPQPLREDQVLRYARHVLLPDVGGRGQARLLAAAVVVELGPGRAAEPAALAYLAAAGVGRLILTGDTAGPLEEGEIACGILFGAADRGLPRGKAAADRIRALNPDVEVILVEAGRAALPPDALVLADELEPAARDAPAEHGLLLADALARAGTAASRLLLRIARHPA